MHTKTKVRTQPYAIVKWLTRLLAGEQSCVWSVWFRAHHIAASQPSEFDFDKWKIDHTALLRPVIRKLALDGYKVSTEEQNQFKWKGKLGTLAGKPDVVAIDDEQKEACVVDAKTGKERVSDRVQVMVYMWVMPMVVPQLKDIPLYGKVVYSNKEVDISPNEITPAFKNNVTDLLKEVFGPEPPPKVPSYSECRWCPITPEDCEDRVGVEDLFEAETDLF